MSLKNIILTTIGISFLFVVWIIKIDNYEDYAPTVIVEEHKFSKNQNIELLKGNKISQEFIAKNNQLGVVSLRFDTHNRMNDDELLFRIKEIGSSRWYYNSKYKTNQFINGRYFSFGFPIINSAKNHRYIFEIASIKGRKGNSVGFEMKNSPFLSRYSFPKEYLQKNKKEIPIFIINKIKSLFDHIGLNIILAIFTICSLLIYLFNLIDLEKLFIYFKKKQMLNLRYIDSLIDRLKNNKLVKYFLIITSILGLFLITIYINGPIRLKAFAFSDDLSSWLFYENYKNNFIGFVFNSAANKFRPVFWVAYYILISLVGGNIWLWGIFNILFNFVIVVTLFFILYKISANILVSFLLSTVFVYSRFAYYNITQGLGLMESMALLFLIIIFYLLWKYLNTGKMRFYVISIITYTLLLLTHERFITLILVYFVILILNKITFKKFLLFIGATMPVIMIWGIKIFILKIRSFDGTGGTDILQTFNIFGFINSFLSSWAYLFGINAGPTYLNGISSDTVPKNIKTLIFIGNHCLLLIIIFFGLIISKSKKLLSRIYTNNFILFVSYIFSTLIAASVTFRIEMRWLYAPYVGLLFLLTYMINIILEHNIVGKICMLVFILWVALTVFLQLFYRSNYKNLYYWGIQDLGNSLYDWTIGKYGQKFWDTDTYIVCLNCDSNGLMSDKGMRLFFRQFTNKNIEPNIHIIKSFESIKNDNNLILFYDQNSNKLIHPKFGSTLRTTILGNGWYGWKGNKSYIWIGKEAEVIFRTGKRGKIIFKGSILNHNLPNTISFFCNNKLLSKFDVVSNNDKLIIDVPKNKIINLKILLDHIKSPKEAGVSEDIRELGISILNIESK